MPFFRYRPFALFCTAFCAAVCCAELLFVRISAPLLISAGVLFSVFSGLFLIFRKKRCSRLFLRSAVCIVFALLGLFMHFTLAYLPERELCLNEGECTAVLLIDEKLYDSFSGGSYKARVLTVNGEKTRGRVLFTCRGGELDSGDVIETAIVFSPSSESGKSTYMRANGMIASADTPEEAEAILLEKRMTPISVSAKLREMIAARIERATAGTDAGICAALLVGIRKGISDVAYLDLTRAGILHMLAISGMHFTVLMGGIGFFLYKLKLQKAVRIVLLFLFAAFYTVIAGFSYSVLRAAIMLFAVYAAYLLKRERDVYTSLFFSVALIFGFQPTAASSVGLWLSAFAALGVILAAELSVQRERKTGRPLGLFGGTVLLPLFVSLCAQTFTLPVVFIAYGAISPAAAPATLACTLPVNLLLFASVVLAVLGTPTPVFTETVSALCRLIFEISAFFSDNVPLYPLTYPFVPYVILAVAVFTAFAVLTAKRTRKVFFCLALAAVAALPAGTVIYEIPRRDVYSLSVQSGRKDDLLVFSSPEGTAVLDFTSGNESDALLAEGLLETMHRTEADALILTRLNNGALNAVLNYGTCFKVRTVYYPAPDGKEEAELVKLLTANISEIRAEAVQYRFGESFEAAGTALCLHSEYAEHSTVPIRAVSAVIGEKNVLYVSSGITHSKYIREIRNAAAKADLLIIGAAGPKNKLPLHFTAECPTVLPSADVLNETSGPYKTLLENTEVYFSTEALVFDIVNAD